VLAAFVTVKVAQSNQYGFIPVENPVEIFTSSTPPVVASLDTSCKVLWLVSGEFTFAPTIFNVPTMSHYCGL